MLETALKSFTTFFATVGPIEAAVLFATLTPKMPYAERQAIATRATLIASAILGFFTLLGGPILNQLGVSLAALQAAGGVILLMISLDMIFARPGGSIKLTPPEGAEAHSRDDVAVFPLATPLLAGPGAMSAGILLAANAHGEPLGLAVVTGALVAVMAITLVLLMMANQLNHFLGVTAQRVLVRVFGILLAAIAVQALFNGIGASGLVPTAAQLP
ncbi:MAG: MarC family protein [Hyphomicrobium sp.]|uniref:MarC family protein n=1 Tax=Hyphomicrobium sp. TaxID=82 RepID=UPI0039E534BF